MTNHQPNNPASTSALPARFGQTGKMRRFVFGDDVFISYSRRRGAEYALALANELTRHKLSCFLDQWGTPPDQDLPAQLRQALKRSSMLVLIGTEWAAASENVRKEVEEFLETRRTIIPITFVESDVYAKIEDGTLEGEFAGTLQQASWYPVIQGVAQTVESTAALSTKQPSETVISRIVNAKGFRSRNKRLRMAFWTTLVSILLLLAAGGVAAKVLRDRVTEANRQRLDAETKATKAERDRVDAEHLTRKANEDLETAQGQLTLASNQLTDANKRREEAQSKAAKAERDQQIAEAKSVQAQTQQARAEQMQRRATSERLATVAETDVESYPQRGLILAAEAVNTFVRAGDEPVPMAEQALWHALANNVGTPLLGHSAPIVASVVSPDNRWLATASNKETLLWKITNETVHSEPIRLMSPVDPNAPPEGMSLRFSADGQWLVESVGRGKAWLWDLRDAELRGGKFFALENAGDEIQSAGFTGDGRWAVSVGWSSALLWDLNAADSAVKPTTVLPPESQLVADAESMSMLKRIATLEEATDEASKAERQRLLDQLDAKWSLQSGHFRSVAVSPDFRWLVRSSVDSQPELFDLTAGGPALRSRSLGKSGVRLTSIRVSPDQRWLAAMDESDRLGNTADEERDLSVVYLWDLSALALPAPPMVLSGHQKYIRMIAFSPDSRWLVTGSDDRTAQLWNLNQMDPRASAFVLAGHPGTVSHVAFSPDGRFLATGCTAGLYGTAIDWSLGDGTNFVKLWKLNPSARPEAVGGHGGSEKWGPNLGPVADRIKELSFSPDGKWLVALSSNSNTRPTDGQVVKLWRLIATSGSDFRPGGRWIDEYELRGHEGQVSTAAFGSGGRWLVTGGKDTSARLLDLANDSGWVTFANRVSLPPNRLRADELLRLAQRTAVRNLTVEEWSRTFPTQPYRKFFEGLR